MTGRNNGNGRMQGGFALVTAIFLLLLLAALAAFLVSLMNVQHMTSAQDVQGTRAYHAARTGIEWGVYQIMKPENNNYGRTTNFTTQYACPSSETALPALGGALSGFSISVACASTMNITEGDNSISVYRLTSTASFGTVGAANYVQRQLSATVSTCRKAANGENCE